MRRFKKHAVWVILIAIIVGVVFMLKSRKVAADEETVPASTSSCAQHTELRSLHCARAPRSAVK